MSSTFSCRNCIFSENVEGKQIGCKTKRLEKFLERNEASKPNDGEVYYGISRLCNMLRTDDCEIEEARKQIEPLFGIVIEHGEERSSEDVSKTIESCLELDYEPTKIKIIISSPNVSYFQELMHQLNLAKKKFRAAELIFHLHNERYLRDTEAFKKITKASYFVKLKSGGTLDKDLFKRIDKKINDDLDQICMFETESASIVMRKIMTSLYLNYGDYDLAVDRIRELSIGQNKYEKL